MPTAAREYISRQGVGELSTCQSTMHKIAATIREQFGSASANRRGTFLATILADDDDVEDECLNLEAVKALTNGVYPALWLNLTYDPNAVSFDGIQRLESAFDLRLLDTVQTDRDFR